MNELTEEERAKKVKAGQTTHKHGAHALEARGTQTLVPQEIIRLSDLREMVRTYEGRLDLRAELAARLALICYKVFSDMEKRVNDPDWWEAGVVRRGGTYLAELRRLLDGWPKDADKPKNVIDLLEGIQDEN